ncbi:SDR family oxidoreductase [Polymorphobacter arshaanensis]|uniref:SDR family oxidoreductase n=1 Tax=Glacieibacterium arshaanense TaxID=2511025 RepID=A0A4Y9EQH9_9SPHN|nr:SDR family oxidoreductase [Polymorphobacter arshaanensis]TFU05529.1 SDR family oxidoreductase [Polymorphobacter arshaanensis]
MKIEDLFSVRGKVVVITGGSRGIGEMIARAYVENGAKVYISARNAAVCDGLATELSKIGTCISIPANLGDMADLARFAAEIAAREPKVHILFNNAGASWGQSFDDFTEAGWDKVIDLNLKSVFFLTQKLVKQLAAAATEDDWARVINIGSIDGMHVSPYEAYSYNASKAGVLHMTRMMAKFLAARNIAVNAIAPGYFPSKMTAGLNDEIVDLTMSQTPMRRKGNTDDMAGVALFLGSRASGYLCGSTVTVDGGFATTA